MTPFLPVALSEEVTSAKPLPVAIGEQAIVLWRDASGAVRALEDRCPHRRAPLSLGCVRADGNLQCGYHGWTFDGTGRVVDLPQMRRKARLPAVYRAEPFAAAEANGFVFVSLTQGSPALPALPGLDRHGNHVSALDRDRWIELLLDAPQTVIAIKGVRITEYLVADPEWMGDAIVYERACRKKSGVLPDRLRADFPLTLRLELRPAAGLCRITLADATRRQRLDAVLGVVEGRRGVTAIRWRAAAGGASLTFRPLDGAAIQATPRTASTILEEIGDVPVKCEEVAA